MATEERTRVDFNAPVSLVEQADAVAELLGTSRTQLLIEALRDEIDDLAADEGFQRTITTAYYDGDLDFDTVESILGTEEALRMKLLKGSLNREPPEPRMEGELPVASEFYDGEIPDWMPDDEADDTGSRP